MCWGYHLQKLFLSLTLMSLVRVRPDVPAARAPRILARNGPDGAWAMWRIRPPYAAARICWRHVPLIPGAICSTPIVRIDESEADAFGLDAAREPDGFALTAMQFSEYRKIEPCALEEALFFDHPSGRTRVRMAMDWKAKHFACFRPIRG